MAPRRRIGIIAGSGPEAGLDLWAKVLASNRAQLGEAFHGDLDAPHVAILSVPELGLSMELEARRDEVWTHLRRAVVAIDDTCDVYAIACNTLNFFEPQLRALSTRARLVSFRDCVARHLEDAHATSVAVLGARPIMELGAWSHYATLPAAIDVERPTPERVQEAHELILDIKRHGPDAPGLSQRLSRLVSSLDAPFVLLACTELPLVPFTTDKQVLDVTQVVADALVRSSLQAED